MLKFKVLKVFVFVYKSYKVGSKSESKYRGGKWSRNKILLGSATRFSIVIF